MSDCEISYEFFYRKGESHVHPAIGRRAFLLNAERVETHWVTNGAYDATALDPQNSHPEPSTAVNLREDEWNHATIRITGDAILIIVNNEKVYAGDLHPANDRTFGLFHYCDLTEARVRKVVLKGNWPTELPAVDKQQLFGIQTFELDQRRGKLPASLEHDFRDIDADFSRSYLNYGRDDIAQQKNDGLHVNHTAVAGKTDWVHLSPAVSLHGDVDIIAEFGDLSLKPPDSGTCNVYLEIVFPPRNANEAKTYCRVLRGAVQRREEPLRHITQVEFYAYDATEKRPVFQWLGTHAEACTAGRLRIMRVGSAMSFLMAEYDSDSFRLLHSEEVSEKPLSVGDIRLRSRCHSTGNGDLSLGVVWKQLSVKAERIVNSAE